MANAQKPDFFFRRNGRVHLNRLGRQFSRLLAAKVCALAAVMLDTPCSEVVWRVLDTHSIRQFPLHFPSRASPCAITFQLDSTAWNWTGKVGKRPALRYSYRFIPAYQNNPVLLSVIIKRIKNSKAGFRLSRWPCGLKRRYEAGWLLGSRVRIPPRARIFVSCVCYELCR
jgi:hypothetical protein